MKEDPVTATTIAEQVADFGKASAGQMPAR
jgi:hypothetical protein